MRTLGGAEHLVGKCSSTCQPAAIASSAPADSPGLRGGRREQYTAAGSHSLACAPDRRRRDDLGRPDRAGRLTPAKLAYGGAEGADEEARAFEASLAAGVTLFDTAAMYSNGASERRLGELARGNAAMLATKFPPGILATAEDLPRALEASLARLGRPVVDLYQHHFPAAGRHPPADGADGRRRRGGQDPGGWGEQLLGRADADRARGTGRAGRPPGLQPGGVLAAAPPAGDRRRAGRLP